MKLTNSKRKTEYNYKHRRRLKKRRQRRKLMKRLK